MTVFFRDRLSVLELVLLALSLREPSSKACCKAALCSQAFLEKMAGVKRWGPCHDTGSVDGCSCTEHKVTNDTIQRVGKLLQVYPEQWATQSHHCTILCGLISCTERWEWGEDRRGETSFGNVAQGTEVLQHSSGWGERGFYFVWWKALGNADSFKGENFLM